MQSTPMPSNRRESLASSGISTSPNASIPHDVEFSLKLLIFDRNGGGLYRTISILREGQHFSKDDSTDSAPFKCLQNLRNYTVTALDNQLYVMGGYDTKVKACTSKVRRFNPLTGTWTHMKNMNHRRCKHAACVSSNKIMITGGERTSGEVTKSCEIFDPLTDTWDKKAPLSHERRNHSCTSDGKVFYLTGGTCKDWIHHNMWMLEEYHWQEFDKHYPTYLPKPLAKHKSAVINNTLYFIGGVSQVKGGEPLKEEVSLSSGGFKLSISRENRPDNSFISPWISNIPDIPSTPLSSGCFIIENRFYVVCKMVVPMGSSNYQIYSFDIKSRTRKWKLKYSFKSEFELDNIECALLNFPKQIPESMKNRDCVPDYFFCEKKLAEYILY